MISEQNELKKAGLRVTVPRIKIYQLLEKAGEGQHFSAEDIYKMLLEAGEVVGLATVYRVLTQFESAGLVVRHHFEGGYSVFEMARDDDHNHMVCIKSGRVCEFSDQRLNDLLAEIAERYNFVIADRTLYLYGEFNDGQEQPSNNKK